ncbi:uncharacterized protein LOC116290449, partial [Actinia tenebrosa]|uniref:Uncharacterized protein LOC116290449 n=1 Tax=Actinia tenebrosa TaxID=6105 RepID=A0A6P8HA65_ACTTE
MDESLYPEEASSDSLKRRGKHCAAFGCTNSFYGADGRPTGYHFFRFPMDIQRRNRWCNLIKRMHGKDGFFVTNSTYICSEHFREEQIDKKLSGRWDLKKGAEPSKFSWTEQKMQRKPPAKRSYPETNTKQKEMAQEPKELSSSKEVVSSVDNVSVSLCYDSTENMPSPTAESEILTETPTTSDIIADLQRRMELLQSELADCQQKLNEAEKSKSVLLERQFSLEKIKQDTDAILFYTGFPCYEALISFFNFIEPKLLKMQYWKGDSRLVKDSQDYQEDQNRKKPGPSRKLSYLDEFLLVLMRLKAGLFVQDLADRFGISKGLVSRLSCKMSNSETDSSCSYDSDDSEFNFLPGYVLEVEGEQDASTSTNKDLTEVDYSDTFMPYADEPIANQEWLDEYDKQQDIQKEFERKLQSRYDEEDVSS